MEHYGVVQERQKYVFADEDLAHALAHSSGRFAGTSECGGDDHSTGTGTGVAPSALAISSCATKSRSKLLLRMHDSPIPSPSTRNSTLGKL